MVINVNKINLEGVTAWPFVEAKKLLDKHDWKAPKKGYLLFETGYGPSGLPHLGTFCEVARTVMVMNAVKILAPDVKLRLFVYSDDLDGLRKVPENIPNGSEFIQYIGMPLSRIPDPYGQFGSYAEYMNNKLKEFLNSFGFEYEFISGAKQYESGVYNDILRKTLERTEGILDIMLPTLGDARRSNYFPFLPISAKTGKFAFEGVKSHDASAGTVTFINDLGEEETISVESGGCKLQWKVDWAMRWDALEVDYEMHGKDLTPTAILSRQISKLIGEDGYEGPMNYIYELFTDELGQKISKSKGNGVSMEEWMNYGILESIALFVYDNPGSSKKLYLRTIPKYIDDYIKYSKKLHAIHINRHPEESIEDRRGSGSQDQIEMQKEGQILNIEEYNNPAFHIPLKKRELSENFKIDFALITNLASICNPESSKILFDYVRRYQSDLTSAEESLVSELIEKALNYYNALIKPFKKYHDCSDEERSQFAALKESLIKFFEEEDKNLCYTEEQIQNKIYSVAKEIGYDKSTMRNWFKLLYGTLFGQESGPRMGSFINIYGRENFIKLISF